MVHVIEFRFPYRVAVEKIPQGHTERVRIRRGLRLKVKVVPYVVETPRGPMEVADLHTEDGVSRRVPFNAFRFVD